jgi:two-component system CheB/CheR fusion protein
MSNTDTKLPPMIEAAPPASLASLCERLVIDHFAPAAVLIDNSAQCLFTLGPVERYLHVAPGLPSHDLFAMTEPSLHAGLLTAIRQAQQSGEKTIAPGGRLPREGKPQSFDIAVLPIDRDGEALLLVCFVELREETSPSMISAHADTLGRAAAAEHELKRTHTDLQTTIKRLELTAEEQKNLTEEALSFNDEYRITNEELLASKAELQSLNEALTALNSQLQETLERERTTYDNLQNVLYSTDVATMFLDTRLNIRFFTPATKSLFNILAGDIGRPLADLSAAAADDTLISDAGLVLLDGKPRESQVRTHSGSWFVRRISPYQAKEKDVEGVVITFSDITERKHIADALEEARRQAQSANAAKSRFLAAASHDLRQPLQTLALLHGLLSQTVVDDKGGNLVARFGDTLSAMAGMLNTLLDINQIEAGTVKVDMSAFAIGPLIEMLGDEFAIQAAATGLRLTMVPSSLLVCSDRGLLEQMIRNLISNALKYTRTGRVLIGCRRRGKDVSIEVWDTGIGIPEADFQSIFEEFHQLDNEARERNRGLGLGLSIVKRLADLLGHRIELRSRTSKGSAFGIVVAGPEAGFMPRSETEERTGPLRQDKVHDIDPQLSILVVEDDPQVRELLVEMLNAEDFRTFAAGDGAAAMEQVLGRGAMPDMVIADYNLPNSGTGLQVANQIRNAIKRQVPVLILTGDISTVALRETSTSDCRVLNKPVHSEEMLRVIREMLDIEPPEASTSPAEAPAKGMLDECHSTIYLVDDNQMLRETISAVLEGEGHEVMAFGSCEEFLQADQVSGPACLLIDAYLPGMSGLQLLHRLKEAGRHLPSIMITGHSDVALAVEAMKAGASDFIEKPVGRDELLAIVRRALSRANDETEKLRMKVDASSRIAGLTARQQQIMDMVLAGHPNKNIAADLGISQRTVENHRAAIMKRTGSKSLPALARLAVAAGD